MKKRQYILAGGVLVLTILAVWWFMPEQEQISSRMPAVLVNADTGEIITSRLYMQGTWRSSHYDDKLRFVGNFLVGDISQTHIGGGDQYELTLVRAGEEYITDRSEINIASTVPVIKDLYLCTDLDKAVFIGTWDIYLDGHRHEASRLYIIAPACNIEEAQSIMGRFNYPTIAWPAGLLHIV